MNKTTATAAPPGQTAENQKATGSDNQNTDPSAAPAPSIAKGGIEDSSGGGEVKTERGRWVESVKTDILKPHPTNKKLYGDAYPPDLRLSIEEEGIKNPLLAFRQSMRIASGHLRYAIAIDLKFDVVPIIFIDGDFTEEEEVSQILAFNVGRAKTPEMKVREYQEYLRIEKPLAQLRQKAGVKGGGAMQNFAEGASREKAAEKVGVSHASLETGIKVLEAIDKLNGANQPVEAEELRRTLNECGYSPALKRVQEKGWHAAAGAKKAVKAPPVNPRNAQAQPKSAEEPGVTQAEHKNTQAVSEKPRVMEVEKVERQDATDSSLVATESIAKEAHVPAIVIGHDVADAAKRAGEYLDRVTTFLRDNAATRMPNEQRLQLGKDIGKLNRFAKEVGITVVAN